MSFTKGEEAAYDQGKLQAAQELLRTVIVLIGPEAIDKEGWRLERARVVSKLRMICNKFGDNSWSSELSLEDVLEKYLYANLLEAYGEEEEYDDDGYRVDD